jgi:hypothetical protein
MIQESFHFSSLDLFEDHVTDVMKRFVWRQDKSHELRYRRMTRTYLKQTTPIALEPIAIYAPFWRLAALPQQ